MSNPSPLSHRDSVCQKIAFAKSKMTKARSALAVADLKFRKTDQLWCEKNIDYGNALSDLNDAEFKLDMAKSNLGVTSAWFSQTLEDWDNYSNFTCNLARDVNSEVKADVELKSKQFEEFLRIANKMEDELGDLEELYYSNQIAFHRAEKKFESAKVEYKKCKERLLQIVQQ